MVGDPEMGTVWGFYEVSSLVVDDVVAVVRATMRAQSLCKHFRCVGRACSVVIAVNQQILGAASLHLQKGYAVTNYGAPEILETLLRSLEILFRSLEIPIAFPRNTFAF